MDAGTYGANFIRGFDARCQRSIVRIRYQLNGNDYVHTGVVVASTDRSCCVITSNNIALDNIEVEFYDGTRAVSTRRYIRIRNVFKMAVIPIIGLDGIHWDVANFSQSEAILGQTVFTLGYNTDNANDFNQTKEDGTTVTRNFISGSLVSRAGISNEEFKDAVAFVHACATGTDGHMGSAVFNETERLVGINFYYTKTKGVDYQSVSPYGGLVSALDLQTIKHGFEAIYPQGRLINKSLPEIVQFLRDLLTKMELEEEKARGHA